MARLTVWWVMCALNMAIVVTDVAPGRYSHIVVTAVRARTAGDGGIDTVR